MIESVRWYFNIAQDSAFIKLETCTLDVCQGRSIEVDASAWVHMWHVLDEISVVLAPDDRNVAPIGMCFTTSSYPMRHVEAEKLEEGNPRVTPVPSAPATSPPFATSVIPPNQEKRTPTVSALTTTSSSIPTAVSPPNQAQHTPVAGGSALTTSPSRPINGLLVEPANKTPPMKLHGERDNDESMTDELKEDGTTDGQANDAPSWFILSSPPDEVKPKVKLEKRLSTTTPGDDSNTWENKKGECLALDKIGDSLSLFSVARAQAASSAEQNDVFTSAKGTSISSRTKILR